jgi:RHS repeat-associated protein
VSSNGNSTAQKFGYNGKENEEELGKNTLAYGWRDYDPAIGRFNKIDRFSEKYMAISPYSYTANNPIRFIDVKGDSIFIKYNKKNILYDNGKLYTKNKKGNYVKYTGSGAKVNKDGSVTLKGFLGKAVAALDKIRTGGSEGSTLIGDLQNSKYHIKIRKGKNGANGYNVSWDPSDTNGGINQSGSTNRPSFIGLAHELGHAHDALDGSIDRSTWFSASGKNVPKAEQYASHWENRIRGEHGLSLRTHYYSSGSTRKGSLLGLRKSNFNYSNKLSPPTILYNNQASTSAKIKVLMLSNNSTTIIRHK